MRWLTVLGAIAVCAYVAYRIRARLRDRRRPIGASHPTADFKPADLATQAPAGARAMVAPMEATPAVVARSDPNEAAAPVVGPTSKALRQPAREPIELPPGRLLSGPVLAALAALAGIAAIALGATAFASTARSDDAEPDTAAQKTAAIETARAISLLSKPSTQRVPVAGSGGRIVLAVGTAGRGVLVLNGLGVPQSGKAYQAWVIKPRAKVPASAAVFSGLEPFVPLSVVVVPGSVVAITIERAGGAVAPTQTPQLVAQPAA
jgi:hypothetical protein